MLSFPLILYILLPFDQNMKNMPIGTGNKGGEVLERKLMKNVMNEKM